MTLARADVLTNRPAERRAMGMDLPGLDRPAEGMDISRRVRDMTGGQPARRGFRRFHLVRDVDETGVSGTGIVAEGVQFSDGRCALRWTTVTSSTGLYDTILHIDHLHGHGGKTRIVWLDPE